VYQPTTKTLSVTFSALSLSSAPFSNTTAQLLIYTNAATKYTIGIYRYGGDRSVVDFTVFGLRDASGNVLAIQPNSETLTGTYQQNIVQITGISAIAGARFARYVAIDSTLYYFSDTNGYLLSYDGSAWSLLDTAANPIGTPLTAASTDPTGSYGTVGGQSVTVAWLAGTGSGQNSGTVTFLTPFVAPTSQSGAAEVFIGYQYLRNVSYPTPMYMALSESAGTSGLQIGQHPSVLQQWYNSYAQDAAFTQTEGVRDPGLIVYQNYWWLCFNDYTGATNLLHIYRSPLQWPPTWTHIVDLPITLSADGGCNYWILGRNGAIYAVYSKSNTEPNIFTPPANIADWGTASKWLGPTVPVGGDSFLQNAYIQYDEATDFYFCTSANSTVGTAQINATQTLFTWLDQGAAFLNQPIWATGFPCQAVILADNQTLRMYSASESDSIGIGHYNDSVDWRNYLRLDSLNIAGSHPMADVSWSSPQTLTSGTSWNYVGTNGLPSWMSVYRPPAAVASMILNTMGVVYPSGFAPAQGQGWLFETSN
jgi:hypothetical protein